MMVDGSRSAVLHRLGRAGLQGLLELCHVIGVLKESGREEMKCMTNNKIISVP